MGTRVTKYNVGDAKKDDKDHISYLKQDIDRVVGFILLTVEVVNVHNCRRCQALGC